MPKTYLKSIEDLLTEFSKIGYKAFYKMYVKYDIFVGDPNSVAFVNYVLKVDDMKKGYEKKFITFLFKNYKKSSSIDSAIKKADQFALTN